MPDSDAGLAKGALWLASYPKSGNTWTRTLLHNLLERIEGEGGEQDINAMDAYTVWDMQGPRYERILGKPIKECDRADLARVRPEVQAEIVEQTRGLSIFKTHHALVLDRGTPTLNFAVTSGAVYIVRNPLDVAISFSHHLSVDVDTAIRAMARKDYETAISDRTVYEVYGSWSLHVESWTRKPHRSIYVMRYEDMLEDPLATFGGLARHMRLEPTQEQLASAIDASAFDKLQAQEEKHGFREKPEGAERFFREGKAGQWREQLTRRQVRQLVQDHHEQMRRFGYLTPDIEHLAP